MKDRILQRVKEYNVVAPFEKLSTDLDAHYKNKLLSVASGSYDRFYAKRFYGKKTGKGEIGCKIPNIEQYQLMEKGIKHLGNHVYNSSK